MRQKRIAAPEDEWLWVRDAAALVARLLYGGPPNRGEIDLVRHRIDRAARTDPSRFPVKEIFGRRYVGRDGFLIWAVDSWPELATKVKLPRREFRIVPHTGSIGTSGNAPDVYQTPADIEQLRGMYAAERHSRRASENALVASRHELASVARDNLELKAKFTKKKKVGRDSQRKGGRGRIVDGVG